MQGPDRIARLDRPALVVDVADNVPVTLKLAVGAYRNKRACQIAIYSHRSAGVHGNRITRHLAIHGQRSAVVHRDRQTIQASIHGERAAVDVCDRSETCSGHSEVSHARFNQRADTPLFAEIAAESPREVLVEDEAAVVDDIALQAV